MLDQKHGPALNETGSELDGSQLSQCASSRFALSGGKAADKCMTDA